MNKTIDHNREMRFANGQSRRDLRVSSVGQAKE